MVLLGKFIQTKEQVFKIICIFLSRDVLNELFNLKSLLYELLGYIVFVY